MKRRLQPHLRAARRALALFAAMLMLAALAMSGHRYFVCTVTGATSFDAFCDSTATHADDVPTVDEDPCCQTRHIAASAPGVGAPSHAMPAAPAVTMPVALVDSNVTPLEPGVRTLGRDARAGPHPPDARMHRLRSMVFLT